MVGFDAERASLRTAVLHQDVAEPEARLFDDVLEQDRLVALRRQCADIVDTHRLVDPGDDVGIGLQIAAQRRRRALGLLARRSVGTAVTGCL